MMAPMGFARCHPHPSHTTNSPQLAQRASVNGILASGLRRPRVTIMASMYLGMDFGTSGARATVIDENRMIVSDVKKTYPQGAEKDWPQAWESVLWDLIAAVPDPIRAQLAAVAIDGTSATSLLLDAGTGRVLQPVKLYNEAQSHAAVQAAKAIAPPAHTATASTSTLCKLLTWHQEGALQQAAASGLHPRLLHQADWLASLLHGDRSVSDWNNALKLGYDPEAEAYPAWLTSQAFAHVMPARVVAPGTAVAKLIPAAAGRSGLPADCLVCSGTTDSIAAFVAAGVSKPGQAVTSLGSTLAVKLLSNTRVDDAAYGVYSHRLGNSWLVGGASNTGGAVLRSFFTDAELQTLTARLDPSRPTGLDYYPLTCPGERFPINDPDLPPRLEPRPQDDAVFLQGILESIGRIEAEAFHLLAALGATPVTEVLTAGGGAANAKWSDIRSKAIGVPVFAAAQGEASYGAALLARQGALGLARH